MKRLFSAALLCLASFTSNAQGLFDKISGGTTGILLRNGAIDNKSANISGTPYLDDKFYYADISDVPEKVLTRYNTATDEIEIKKEEGEKEFLLPKTDEYNKIITKYGAYVLRKVTYTSLKGEFVNGYLVELWSNETATLYRRDKMRVEAAREGNGYTGFIPASYVKATPEYYMKVKDKDMAVFPKNKKAITEMYPAKKSEVDAFFKNNNLSWKQEQDMAKIMEFISTL